MQILRHVTDTWAEVVGTGQYNNTRRRTILLTRFSCIGQDQSYDMFCYLRYELLEVAKIAVYSFQTFLTHLLLEFHSHR